MNFSQYAFGITKNSILEYFSGPITKHFSLDKKSFDEFVGNLKLKDIEKLPFTEEVIEPKRRESDPPKKVETKKEEKVETKKEEKIEPLKKEKVETKREEKIEPPKEKKIETKKEEKIEPPKEKKIETKKEEKINPPKEKKVETKREEKIETLKKEKVETFQLFCEDEASIIIFEKILPQIKGATKMDKIYTFPEASKEKIIRALTSKNCKYINLTDEEMKPKVIAKEINNKNKWGSVVGELNIVYINGMAIGTQTDDEEQIFCLTEKEIKYCKENNIKYDESNLFCELENIEDD